MLNPARSPSPLTPKLGVLICGSMVLMCSAAEWAGAEAIDSHTSLTETRTFHSLQDAQAWTTLGLSQWQKLELQEALKSWQNAEAAYRSQGDAEGVVGSVVNQLQALQTLGYYNQALKLADRLEELLKAHRSTLSSAVQLLGRRQLAQIWLETGHLEAALTLLQESDRIPQSPQELSVLRLNVGNVLRALAHHNLRRRKTEIAQRYFRQAQTVYQSAQALDPDRSTAMEIAVNALSLSLEDPFQTDRVPKDVSQQALSLLDSLQDSPPGLAVFKMRLHLLQSLVQFLALKSSAPPSSLQQSTSQQSSSIQSIFIQPTLVESSHTAIVSSALLTPERLKNILDLTLSQLDSFPHSSQQQRLYIETLSLLATIATQAHHPEAALPYLQQALIQAQSIQDHQGLALLQWQMSKVLVQLNKIAEASVYYKGTFHRLQRLRSNLVGMSVDTGFSVQAQVSEIYRDYIHFLLTHDPKQADLQEALQVMEALHLVELNNFFNEPCFTTHPIDLKEVLHKSSSPSAAIYSIILHDSLAIILLTPDGTLHYTLNPVSEAVVNDTALAMRSSLNPAFPKLRHLHLAHTFYQWFVQPFEAELTQYHIENLVFILDDVLQNVPVAAFYDGSHYLLERYNLAITPGLSILPPSSEPQGKVAVLMAALTTGRSSFRPLPGVEKEIAGLSTTFRTAKVSFETIANESFSFDRLKQELSEGNVTVLHLATHGQFSSDPQQTFILTGDDWHNPNTEANRIVAQRLDQLLQNRYSLLDLLVFSACQTALGDGQASLGLAGLAARSGARSTLGTLWAIDDGATAQFMVEFYRHWLGEGVNKAAALRETQLHFFHSQTYSHPYYWAAFVLIGNWN